MAGSRRSEAQHTAGLTERLRSRGVMTLSLQDRFTRDVPDVAVLGLNKTLWTEVKLIHVGLSSAEIPPSWDFRAMTSGGIKAALRLTQVEMIRRMSLATKGSAFFSVAFEHPDGSATWSWVDGPEMDDSLKKGRPALLQCRVNVDQYALLLATLAGTSRSTIKEIEDDRH